MRMPWGKYRDEPMSSVPLSYLAWIVEASHAHENFKKVCREEIVTRLGTPPRTERSSAKQNYNTRWVIDWCRRASIACHPDFGGSVKLQKLVNELREHVGQ